MEKQHHGGLEILKLIMSLMVVGIHTNPFASLPALNSLTSNGIFRIAVPVFFVMNGYFLSLERDKFLPWLRRIVLLYLLLSLLFSPLWLDTASPQDALLSIVQNLATGWHHLWYLAALIVAACLAYLGRAHLSLLLPVALLCFVAGIVLQAIALWNGNDFAHAIHGQFDLYRNALTVALPFLLIGMALRRRQTPLHVSLPLLLLVGVLFVGEIVLWGWLSRNQTRDLYASLIVVAPVLFLAARQVQLNYRDHMSARIYYFHPIFEMAFKLNGKFGGGKVFLVTAVLSALLAYAIGKLKTLQGAGRLGWVRLIP
ncbi:acyltransferase family protein [Herbaspirillum seropedicae]|uniref:acyltransferase family protein n=1 Tax=Herbaspirillum seropedicae TaxID=964 RepID=UPI0008480117|nr:acyltransferase family protein [Herbaspirillum seropedicae]AON54333.1 acyltransferase [Herbaspirillum seropedicae]